ncbi:DUF5979 domain-containing protein [Microbacterium sulfonylureivorans]|uniref:DUF5979 domain-containing protein n=1 Tax=Microbacterium sulfonylureivorans TaxID=2486854 RepID=UPI0013E0E85F|nr:DUF5979 domain-containing protein [Microbacterium sulfonylureivorans]
MAVAAMLTLSLAVSPTAFAAPVLPDPAPGDVTAVASLTKDASVDVIAPGETFTYTLTVGCSSITDVGCRDAVLTDVVPAPFVVVDAVVGAGVNTALEPAISGNTVTVTWVTDLDGASGDEVGILDATTGVVEITAQLPADASYDANGVEVFNEAYIEGANFVDVPASAGVTPVIPLDLATTPAKTIAPGSAIATPGTPVTATLGGSNDSNATVDTLVIQDPAVETASPNPFEYLGFAGFGTVAPPAGTTTTTYEVYVPPTWVAAPGGVLPAGVDAEDVRGTRVTFDGEIPAGATASVELDLATTDLAAAQSDGTVVENTVSSEVALDGESATADTSADFTILANDVQVGATKSFDPNLVVAGEPSTVTIGATNESTIPLEELTIREPAVGDFPAEYTFAGVTSPVDYPAGATSGTIVYHLIGGGEQSESFVDGAVPPATEGDPALVAWFEVVFEGTIQPGAETSVVFDVATDPDLAGLPLTVTNVVGVQGENQGVTGDADASADLYIYDEVVEPYIGKQVRPSQILAVPGQIVTVSLAGGLTDRPNPPDTTTGSTGNAQVIVIQDPQDPIEGDVWWNAFDITAITQTPVPAQSSLTIEYYDTTDGQWKVLTAGIDGPQIYSAPIDPTISAVAGGIRFTYTYTGDDGLGFPPGTDLAPNFTSELRPTGRYTGTPPFSDDESTFVPNCAQSSAEAITPGVPGGSATMPTEDCPEVELIPADPGNADLIDKAFGTSSSGGLKSVIARSGDTIPSTLSWSTGGYSGLETVQITDVAAPSDTPIAASMYDAFNLTRVQAITPATDPLIVYDQVLEVLLWNGTAWVDATNDPCPAGCVGQFPGVNLTAAEQASTTGVRLIFAESPDRAAASAGSPDAPPVGSGVARSFGNTRPVTLVWQVRDERRSDGVPVLGDVVYNLAQPGVVRNTARAEGFPAEGDPIGSDASDDVVIVDVPITTTTDKNWQGGPLAVPTDPSIPAGQYPLSRITVTTRNTTPARVDQLVINDPAPGSATNRRQDPFEAFTFNNFSSITVPAGTTSSSVRLFCPSGQAPADYTVAQALALVPAALPCDVTGIQVTFDGRIAANGAGVVAFDVRLRPYWRGTTERVSVADSPISNTAQGIVADIEPIGACPPPADSRYACDQETALIQLQEPTFSVTAGKSFSPASQKDGDTGQITMTLTGQPGGSARPRFMTITDEDPTFWNAMDFAGMAPTWTLPVPVGQVRACYLSGGDFSAANVEADSVGGTWTCQPITPGSMTTATATAFLDAAPDDLHGVRFTFAQANDLGWQNPSNPVVSVPVLLERRTDLRSGGPVPTTRADQVPSPGEEDAGIFWNTVEVDGESANVGSGPLTDSDTADAEYRYLHLEAAITVTKSPNGDIRPGAVVPFTLTFTNSGEAPLHDPLFEDRLPTDEDGIMLVLDPDRDPTVSPYAFALTGAAPVPPNGTALPTDPDEVDVDVLDDTIFFRMPGGSVLEPGQTYTITIQLMLRPGLPAGTQVQNWAVVSVDEPLDDCVPTTGPDGECMDDAIVSPLAVPALSTIKYVRSDVDHGQPGIPEVFSTIEGYECDGTAVAGRFYRAPCIPVTLPGGTETWRFRVVNAGTLPLDQVVSIDNLPTPGDQGLIVQLPRESEWEPTFVGAVELVPTATTPAGAVLTTYYSTSAVPCTADLNPLGAPCGAGAWLPLDGSVDPALVRSLKFVVEFPDADPLQPAETLDIQFQTRTTPEARAASDFPIAYNTVSTGGSAIGATPTVVPATEGRRVGVSHPTGPIELQKIVSGPAAEFAPDGFPVQLTCESAGVEVLSLPELVLVPGADPVVVDRLPWGSECTASEGQYGQTSTIIGTAIVGGPEDEIGLISVENVYEVSALTIRKTVDGGGEDALGDPVVYGPFAFSVSCTFDGVEVWATGYDADNPMAESLTTDETWALAGLPVGTECVVTEDDTLDAVATSFVVSVDGEAQEPVEGTEVTVTVVDGASVDVEAINEFTAGSLILEKVRDGEAWEEYGQGPFRLAVDCTFDTGSGPARVWAGFVTLDAENGYASEIEDIATGATCTVAEVTTGGATAVAVEPGEVTIGDAGTPVTVVVTNTFDAGSITVTKEIVGDGADLWGAGPFEVTLACTTPLGLAVDLPFDPVRELAAPGYTTTYEPLLIGLDCTVTETDTGGATSTIVTDAQGEPIDVIEVPADDVAVTVTNTFDLGSLAVTKTVSGGDAAAHEDDVFEVSVACIWDGQEIEVPGGAVRPVTAAEPALYEDLPVGAECAVTETDAGDADAVTLTPASSDDPSTAIVTIEAAAEASVNVDNRFDPPLPATGSDSTHLAGVGGIAFLVIAAGVLAVVGARRRRDA